MDQPHDWAATPHWRLYTKKGLLRIEKACVASWPCQHRNNQQLDAVDIWQLLEQSPQLEAEQPELWAHFSVYRGWTHFEGTLL